MRESTTACARAGEPDEPARLCTGPRAEAGFWEPLAQGRPRLLESIRASMGPGLLRLYDPEDILQEALLKALDPSTGAPASLGENSERLLPWLLGVARNRLLVLARLNRGRRRPQARTALPPALLVLDHALLEQESGAPLDGPAGRIDREQVSAAVRALRSLTAEQHLCVMLHDLHDLPLASVAFALGRSKPAVNKLHQRARRRLGSAPVGGRARGTALPSK